MKKSASMIAVFLAIWLLLVQASSASAPDDNKLLRTEKLIERGNTVSVGDDVTILLKFTNPFGRELPIKIVDKNAFGNNGIDIQCMEYTIPSQKETTVAYDPIKPLKSGKYTLDSAEVTYTNPATGKSETVKSNTLDVSVNDSGTGAAQQGSAQGMTTIYRCNGMNMQSTSYSSSSSSSGMQVSVSNSQQQQQQQQQSQPNQQQPPQNRVQNNQMNQNANALKQQMDSQLQQQRQTEAEFQKSISGNEEFRKMHENLLRSGYNLTAGSVNALANDTGSFEIRYNGRDGETAQMKGEMKNGTMTQLMSQTSKEVQSMLNQLQQNTQFKQYREQLAKAGFNQSMQPIINQASQERTEIAVPYKNSSGDEKKIIADYINGTLQKVSMEQIAGEEDQNSNYLRLFLLAIMAALGWTIYSKLKRRNKGQTAVIFEKKIEAQLDYAKEAEEMIAEAERLFRTGREKDAYEKVSQAVRFYYSHRLGLLREVTSSELLATLKSGKLHSDVRECLDACGLVEFAKYEPNAEDFGEIAGSARKFIRFANRSSPQPASRRSGAP